MLQFCYRPLPLKAFAAPDYCFSQACNFQVLDIGADFSFFFLGLAKDELSLSFPAISPSLPFTSRPPKYSWRGAASSHCRVWCILEPQSAVLVAAVFVDFLRTK